MGKMTDATVLDHVRRAVAAGEWDTAATLLLDAAPEPTAEVLELTAQVAYGAGDFDGTVTAFERLHALRLAEGDILGAAHAAAMVAVYLLIDAGMLAPVRGWVARAERLLEGAGETPVDALLAMVRTFEHLLSGDVDQARRWAPIAVELGVLHDVGPAVAMGRNGVARIAILDGQIEEGLTLLDELGAALMAGEYDPLTTGMVYCEIVCAMQGLAQYDRAEQWTEAMERWRVGNAFGGIHGRCRVHRAEILKLRGDCATAEAEALRACDELRPWMRREFGWPLTELGNIRLRAGDHEGAEEAFLAAQEHGWEPQPGFALLRLAQGDVAAARALVREALDHPLSIPSKERPPFGELRRAPLLEAEVSIAIAAGDVEASRVAAAELTEIAGRFHSEGLAAAAAVARARVALAAGEPPRAVAEAATAVGAWTDIGAPYETAIARGVLADAFEAAGNPQPAVRERRAAQATLDRLGARAVAVPTTAAAAALPAHHCEFRRDGDVRVVAFDGRRVQLQDLKGFRYLEILFAYPGREFHVLDLVAQESGAGSATEATAGTMTTAGTFRGAFGADTGPVIDEAARAAYRRRLQEIDDDIDEATRANDGERRARAEAERGYLVAELARGFGLDGRSRRTGAAAERARSAVTRTITYAVARLRGHHPSLAEHLDHALHTGTYVSYAPDRRANITWNTRAEAPTSIM